MRYILLIITLNCLSLIYGQESNTSQLPLDYDQSSYFVERPTEDQNVHFADKKSTYERTVIELINSGRVILDDSLNRYLNTVLKKVSDDPVSIYSFQSGLFGTFCSSHGEIFITTGLLSKIDSPALLYFFIAREVAKYNNYQDFSKREIEYTASYFNKTLEVMEETAQEQLKWDKLALEICQKQNLIDRIDIPYCFELLRNKHEPFVDTFIPNSYFEVGDVILPADISNFHGESTDSLPGLAENEKTLAESINKRLNNVKQFITEKTISRSSDQRWYQLRKKAQELTLTQEIRDKQYESAIYNIFLQEAKYGASLRLDELRAYSWLGLAMKSIGEITPQDRYRIYQWSITGKKANFFFIIRKLDGLAITAIAIQHLNQLKNKWKENSAIQNCWRQILQLIKGDEQFKLRHFAGSDKFIITDSTYVPDTSCYYSNWLINVFKDDSFLNDYQSNELKVINENSTIKVYPIIELYKKGKNISNEAKYQSVIEQKTELYTFGHISDLSNTEYSEVKSSFSQMYSQNQYSELTACLPINLDQTGSEDYIAFAVFQYSPKVKFRKIHTIGLLGVTIPYVVSDIIIRSNDCLYAFLLIDRKSGIVKYIEYERYFEPLTPKLMNNRIYHSVTSFYE